MKLICFQIKLLLGGKSCCKLVIQFQKSNQPSQRFYMISMSHCFSTRCCQIGFLRLSNNGEPLGNWRRRPTIPVGNESEIQRSCLDPNPDDFWGLYHVYIHICIIHVCNNIYIYIHAYTYYIHIVSNVHVYIQHMFCKHIFTYTYYTHHQTCSNPAFCTSEIRSTTSCWAKKAKTSCQLVKLLERCSPAFCCSPTNTHQIHQQNDVTKKTSLSH